MVKKTDWGNVPFGTKVRAWNSDDDEYAPVGRFLCYDGDDEDNIWLPFYVFIEDEKDALWFECCEIVEGGDIVG